MPPLLKAFLEETGLQEFGYDDFKRWLEPRRGSLTAEECGAAIQNPEDARPERPTSQKSTVNDQ